MADKKNDPVPQLLLERLALGELSEDEARAVRARLEERGELSRLDELEASNRAILEELPPAQAAHQIETRLRLERERAPERPRALQWGGLGTLVAAAAAVVVFVAVPGVEQSADKPAPPDEVIRTKGLAPKLVVHKRATTGVERLADGARAAPGDVLQIAYVAAGHRWGVIVSVDGAGAVTPHLPDGGGARAASLDSAGAVSLDHSYQLDDAPSFERFFFVASDQPFDSAVVLQAARAAAASGATELSLPDGLEQATFLVTKPAG